MAAQSITQQNEVPINIQSALTDPGDNVVKVTRREQEVLTLVAEGHTSKSMAEQLSISARTIERHRANLLKKFCQKNSVSLVQSAMRQGLL
ncbi:MAG: helix-turn-helix transcriptional regulator [Desulfoarculaceae bacterium]|nr:helix-turn-helix transcriptional regulator [Desulfoarculaceae bacterium]